MNSSHWEVVELSTLIDVKHGFAFKGEFITEDVTKYVLLTPGNFSIGGGFKGDKFKYYLGEVPNDYVLEPYELLITMTDLSKNMDTLGYPAFVPNNPNSEYLHNQRLGKVIIKEPIRVDKAYLYYLLCTKNYRDEIKASSSGSVIRHTSPERIKKYKFSLPPLPEQRAIAEVLSALDDKIELNRRMNQTLEELAQALFKHFFTDNPEKEEWPIGTFSDICKIAIGGDWGSDTTRGEDQEVICLRGVDLEHLRKEGFSEEAPIRWIKQSSLEKRRMTSNDVLIAGSGVGPVGRPIWVSPSLLKLYKYEITYSNFCKKLVANTPAHAVYVDRLLHNMHKNDEILDFVNGTSLPNLDINGLISNYPISIPPEKLLLAFYNIVEPFSAILHTKETQTLTELRDTLLPKMMSGQVRVV